MKVIQKSNSGSIQLSPNFYLSEMLYSETAIREGIENVPDPLAVKNLYAMALLLEEVRKLLGNKVISVSSGFRCLELNTRIGSSNTSDHVRGSAADFSCHAYGTPLQICAAIAKSNIKFGKLIFEGTWVHISLPDGEGDGQVLTAIFKKGEKTRYVPGLPV